jgi:hypothetical protein
MQMDGKQQGETRQDGSKHLYTTAYCLRVLIENSQFKNHGDQCTAYKVYQKLVDEEIDVELEDAEFDLMERMAKVFPPFTKGILFLPFLQLFDKQK